MKSDSCLLHSPLIDSRFHVAIRAETLYSLDSIPINQKYPPMKKTISKPPVHRIPKDLREALAASPMTQAAWKDLTPLARNEWICWVISVKKLETRRQHIQRACAELIVGKRRPCCFPGCIHR